jgi:hypothetical protein
MVLKNRLSDSTWRRFQAVLEQTKTCTWRRRHFAFDEKPCSNPRLACNLSGHELSPTHISLRFATAIMTTTSNCSLQRTGHPVHSSSGTPSDFQDQRQNQCVQPTFGMRHQPPRLGTFVTSCSIAWLSSAVVGFSDPATPADRAVAGLPQG